MLRHSAFAFRYAQVFSRPAYLFRLGGISGIVYFSMSALIFLRVVRILALLFHASTALSEPLDILLISVSGVLTLGFSKAFRSETFSLFCFSEKIVIPFSDRIHCNLHKLCDSV